MFEEQKKDGSFMKTLMRVEDMTKVYNPGENE